MSHVTPLDRTARPSAFSKLFYFMRPDKARMVLSLVLACLGEAAGMVPYVVVALLAAGLIEGTLTLEMAALFSLAAAGGQILKFVLTWRSSMISHGIAFKALRTMRRWPRRCHACPWASSSTRPRARSRTASWTT